MCAFIALVATSAATGASEPKPGVPGYGTVQTIENTAMLPDPALRYRVVFNITQPSTDAAAANPSLEKVARFLNLLATQGIRPKKGDVVAVVHAKATPSILKDAAWRQRHGGTPNPNLELIARLRAAGAEVHVCSQAMAKNNIGPADVDSHVQVDLAALTTLSTLQLQNYALIPD